MQRLIHLALLAAFLLGPAVRSPAATQQETAAKPDSLAAAQQALEAKEYKRAVALLEEYLAQHPEHLGARFNLAYGYSLLGRAQEAIAAYRQALALDPKLFQAYLNAGLLLIQEGAPAEAAKLLAQAIQLRPEHVGARLAYADALTRSGDKQSARGEYEAVLSRSPENSDAQLGLARFALEAGEWAQAEKHLRSVLKQDPNRLEARPLRAEALFGLNRLAEAAQELETYLAARPDDAGIREQAARIYRELGENEAALRHYAYLLTAGTRTNELEAARARTLAALDRWAEAAAVFERLVAVEPSNAEFHYDLGLIRLRLQHPEAAAEALREAVRLRPGFIDALNSLALASEQAGNCAEALHVLDARATHAPENAGTYFLRAICHDRLHHLDAAIENYEKFLAANSEPDSPRAFQARARLRLLKRQRERR